MAVEPRSPIVKAKVAFDVIFQRYGVPVRFFCLSGLFFSFFFLFFLLNLALVCAFDACVCARWRLTAKEREWLNGVDKFLEEETGYIDIQATKPQTIGYALHDSPSTIL